MPRFIVNHTVRFLVPIMTAGLMACADGGISKFTEDLASGSLVITDSVLHIMTTANLQKSRCAP